MRRPSGNLIAYVILSAGIIAAFFGVYVTQQNDRQNAEHAYLYACEQRNASIIDDNVTSNSIADLLEGLQDVFPNMSSDTAALLDEAIAANRADIPLIDCTYPPDD